MTGFGRFNLFVAFAFTVMADPVSSVAYALQAALAHLDGDLRDLTLTMALVLATIAVVAASYHQLIARFPNGGGGAEALAQAFGDGWAFLPAGALLVDFTLTIAVSCAAAGSALIAYLPALAPHRIALTIALAGLVAAGSALGHRGRIVFATATLAFVALAVVTLARGLAAPAGANGVSIAGHPALGPAVLAIPLGMALATGVEAPSNAIAQLGQLDDRGRARFGQATIWIMLVIVAGLTLAIAAISARLGTGVPPRNSTLLAETARQATGGDANFAAFQGASALLLLAAAASSFLAGSGLLKALALHGARDGDGLIPGRFGHVNRFLVPWWGLLALLATAVALVALAGGHDQTLVRFYAVAVFASFLGALVGCARLSRRDGRSLALAVNVLGIALVTFVLALNVERGVPLVSLAAAGAISLYLWRAWVKKGRPEGVATVFRDGVSAHGPPAP